MKQYIFNLCLWLSCLLIIISISSILIYNQKKLSKQITKNNITYNYNKNKLSQLCGNNKSTEPFEPYNDSYTEGFFVKNVLCSNFDVSESLNTSADMTFYNTTESNKNKTDKNKTITISKDGNISGVNNIAVSNEFKISNKDNILINNTKLFDLIYPVGSIYISINSTSPATLFGGTWEQIKGKFLYSTNNNLNDVNKNSVKSDIESTGGNENITLTTDNLPKHNHTMDIHRSQEEDGFMYGLANSPLYRYRVMIHGDIEEPKRNFSYTQTTYTGGNKAFSILPPYYKVYMWKRTKL